MPARNPKEVFLMLLSNARQNTERAPNVYREISQAAEKPDVREALESRSSWTTSRKNSQKYNPHQRDICSFWRGPSIWLTSGSPSTRCSSLRRMSPATSAWVFLESVLADKLAFLERDRRLVRHIIAGKIDERVAA